MSDKTFTWEQLRTAIWEELKENEFVGDDNNRAHTIIGIVSAAVDRIALHPSESAGVKGVWVKGVAKENLLLPAQDLDKVLIRYNKGRDRILGNADEIRELYTDGWEDIEWLDESTAAQGKEDAVLFAEWLEENYVSVSQGNDTILWRSHQSLETIYTTAQLYDIYQSKNK